MNIFIGVIVGLLVLMTLITLHEFGHFIAARRNGVKVLEFGICFPPRAIAWVKGSDGKWHKLPKSEWDKPQKGLIFSLNWLPIGGFCQMDGESANDKRPHTFGASSFWSKTKILFAGVAMNWLTAFVILTILAWTGMPKFIENQFSIASDETFEKNPAVIVEVLEDSPAAKSGLVSGDKILAINGEEVTSANMVSEYNHAHAGETVTYTIEHFKSKDECCEVCDVICEEGYVTKQITAELNPAGSEYALGISMDSAQTLYHSTWSAPIVGLGLTAQITGETFKGVGELIWNLVSGVGRQLSFDDTTRSEGREAIEAAGDSVSGPVGIIGVLFPAFTSAGPTNVAFLAALISISLACMNVLPIPALDGGRWLLIAIYKLRKKELTKEKEEKIVSRAFAILLALIALVTVLDVVRFF